MQLCCHYLTFDFVTVNQEIFGSINISVPPEYSVLVAINFQYVDVVEILKLLCGCTGISRWYLVVGSK